MIEEEELKKKFNDLRQETGLSEQIKTQCPGKENVKNHIENDIWDA